MKKLQEDVKSKHTVRLVIIIILALLAGAIALGYYSVKDMKRMIGKDFNDQQLALAKHASVIVEQYFKILKNELLISGLSPSIQYIESVSWRNRMEISLSSVREYGVFRIMLIDADKMQTYSIDYNRALFQENGLDTDAEYFKWCKNPINKNKVFISSVREGIVENSEPGLVMEMATPVYQISPDEAHPTPTNKFTGALVFSLDVELLTKRVISPIRSGKSGYAWAIDQQGKFLYHMEKKFIGQNAFEARKLEDSHISFTKINLIQKEKMLQGKEGSSWYISGWHRGETGRMEKLIAFAPVYIGGANNTQIWSVAVVAPMSEVQETIYIVYFRQAMIQLVFTLAVIVILFFLRANEISWIKTLERKVKEKTEDLKDYAERLKNSEKRYRSLIESADDMIYALDKDCNILSMNQSWTRLTGQKADNIIGKNLLDVIKFSKPDHICAIVEKVLTEDQAIAQEEAAKIGDREYWLNTKYNRATGIGIFEDFDKPFVLVIARDLSEHKQIESQLFNTQKLASLGELSAGVAHEINNPIAIILGFTEMLLEKTTEETKQHNMLKAIERQGENCKRIVENLLAFSRVQKKETTYTDVAADLHKVIDVVENVLLTEKIDINIKIPDNLPRVYGDSQELEQVYLNIINNAVAAMEDGGLLSISVDKDKEMMRIRFQDTGSGIQPEYLDKIFEPFFTTKEVGRGTGLGLSVSYGIVKKIGGEIYVDSHLALEEDAESGTIFTILLPIVDDTKVA